MASHIINCSSVIGTLVYISGFASQILFPQCINVHTIHINPTKKWNSSEAHWVISKETTADKGSHSYEPIQWHAHWMPPRHTLCWIAEQWRDPYGPYCAWDHKAKSSVIWISKLQTKTTLSSMEAEYVTMSQACKTLFPIIDMVLDRGEELGLVIGHRWQNKIICEDSQRQFWSTYT